MTKSRTTPLPQIAIVGRPNVGKSTLFNRLTRKRSALVSDMPGLTRDRREGEADLGERSALIVDTAGLEEAPSGSIPDRMRAQSEQAILEADLVLFVIDARAGLTGADREFADIVRKSGRPALLVTNKCEGEKAHAGIYEAYELGLGEPIPTSAEHAEGLGDLISQIIAALPAEESEDAGTSEAGEEGWDEDGDSETDAETARKNRPLRLAIVGRPNAGKSTLVNALLGEERMITGPEPGLTRDSISSPFTWRDRDFLLFDTAGLRRKAKINALAEKLSASDAIRAIKFAETVVLLVDAERPLEHQDLTIGAMVADEGRALVIAVNKWDLVPEKQKRLAEIKKLVSDKLSQVPNVPVVAISALAEQGLDKLMRAVVENDEIWNRRLPTHELNRWLVEAVERHQPPAVKGRRVRIRYMTQPSARPPTFVAFASQPEGLPKSYERYLLNSLREAFNMPGVPIRLNFRRGRNPYDKSGN